MSVRSILPRNMVNFAGNIADFAKNTASAFNDASRFLRYISSTHEMRGWNDLLRNVDLFLGYKTLKNSMIIFTIKFPLLA